MHIELRGTAVTDPNGDLDEVIGRRCTAHLERMSDKGFSLILDAGKRSVHVNLFSRCKIGAFVYEDSEGSK